MLKQLLKYEFKATKRLYFGLYLALALLSVVLGVTFRQEHALAHSTSFQNLEVILMIVYVSVILAIAVLCFVNTIQRFYQNLLGREGYLMHTLPVNENQLILSKLLTSMVWVLCSGLVGIVCITVMVSIGVIDSETFGMVDWNSWKQLWQMLYEEIGPEFWAAMAWTILINLARLQRQRPLCPCAGKLRRFRRVILFPDSKRRCVRSGHTAFLFTPDSVYFSSATGSGRSMPPQWLQSRQSRTDSQRLFQVPPSASASGSLHSSHRSRSHPRPGT